MESSRIIIADAAKDLDGILDAGADLYLHSIKTPGAPLVRAAFGFSLEPLQSSRVACLAELSCVATSTTKYADFPVLLSREVVDAMRTFFVDSFQIQKGAPQKVADIANRSADSLDDSPHVTRAMLSDLHPTVVALAWACTPQHDIFASTRRRWLSETCFTAETKVENSQRLHQAMKEFLLLDLFLSICPKLKLLWEYRQWLCSSMCRWGLLIDNPEGVNEAALQILRFEAQDDQLFFMAARNHPMNYNAWHYRRLRFRTLHANASKMRTRWDRARVVIQIDSEKVIQFIREHNGDSSAASYLLFLLHEQEALDSKVDTSFSDADLLVKDTHQGGVEPRRSHAEEEPDTSEGGEGGRRISDGFPVLRLAPPLWKTLMATTQTEIRLHGEKGHECMWHLRLGLIQWACTRSPQYRLLSAWRAEDELRWVSTYVALHLEDAADALLSPLSELPNAWTESSGSAAWTSLNAARYGCQLTSILLRTPSCASLKAANGSAPL
ncbi:hypothetical protein CUR178_05045 [Leishmania enriettii]|uniref:Uncharacterized protein n=1 Tax=Leishmania enriettii TaxID=5663 RepID=A0A836HK57_LEIEN|nr:hypothetical protein CUR178_05045 [Leishmania enriettii]